MCILIYFDRGYSGTIDINTIYHYLEVHIFRININIMKNTTDTFIILYSQVCVCSVSVGACVCVCVGGWGGGAGVCVGG